MTQPNDTTDLFKSLRAGNLQAFTKIYRLFSPQVLRFAYSFSISIEDAEEIVQDVFLKLWEKRTSLDLNKSPDTLIFVMAKNFTLNKIKKCSVEQEHLKQYFRETKAVFTTDVEDLLNFKEAESYFQQIIDELPKKRREIFTLNRLKGLTYKETAELLDISTGTVEKQMSKALKTITEKFESYCKLLMIFLALY